MKKYNVMVSLNGMTPRPMEIWAESARVARCTVENGIELIRFCGPFAGNVKVTGVERVYEKDRGELRKQQDLRDAGANAEDKNGKFVIFFEYTSNSKGFVPKGADIRKTLTGDFLKFAETFDTFEEAEAKRDELLKHFEDNFGSKKPTFHILSVWEAMKDE